MEWKKITKPTDCLRLPVIVVMMTFTRIMHFNRATESEEISNLHLQGVQQKRLLPNFPLKGQTLLAIL